MPISSLNKLSSGQVTLLQTFNECQLESNFTTETSQIFNLILMSSTVLHTSNPDLQGKRLREH
jgi:hypothetical protein